ncbi:MAG: metal ABC transporter ATP-binding protein [Micromonosporaceae bacterium]
MPMNVVDVADGVVSYGAGRPVLRGVTLRVPRGETVAILGANGSGKSTLVRAALGLVPLSAGNASLFGTPLRRFRKWKQIGYVPQRLGAGGGVPATVREVVASGRLARRGLFRPSHPADAQAVADAIGAVGLADRASEPVSSLSGGQQQRTLIARALAGEPELLVLDEPTAGVDVTSQVSFAAALRRFADGGGTIVLVAHELGPLEPLVGRAVVLHHGEVVHDGAVPEPAGHHATPGHDHVHPHAPVSGGPRWTPRGEAAWSGEP